ncbi:MAG: PKD domain-containing protein [Acidobacteria bacterium]|nr:PKD domain-containing protein [Acidobacteriota bacterium]
MTISSDVNQMIAGTSTGTPLHITARHADGTAPADGTEVAVNTNIGSFGIDAAGKPVLLAKTVFTGGKATVEFFAGSDAGIANILAQSGTNIGRLNLPIVAAPAVPVANFTFSANALTVLFTDASTGSPSSYRWMFGDATESTEKNPTHVYPVAGTYPVTLIVSNAGGQSSKSQFVTVSLGTGPQAAFDFQVVGKKVNFVDKSAGNPTSWSWTFGDGGTSTEQNPIHTYAEAGPYTVSLTAKNGAGENTTSKVVTIGAPPQADFDFQDAGLKVNFVDRSTGTPTSWSWAFGDGGTSTEQNPVHTYAAAGTFTVSLKAANAAGESSTSKPVTVTPGTPPAAKFSATVNGNQVNFVDQSTGNPTAWAWTFGDGASASSQNPVHVYASAGSYTVTLKVTNAAGSNSSSQVVVIAAGVKADFTYTANGFNVSFSDRSTGTPTTWSWDFGDGTATDPRQNPTHTYAAAGTYTVTLTAANASGSNSKSTAVTLTAPPTANFTFSSSGLVVTFTDTSTGSPTSWSWNFGDGARSTAQNPSYAYAAPGTYNVTLTATNAGGSSSATKPVTVP